MLLLLPACTETPIEPEADDASEGKDTEPEPTGATSGSMPADDGATSSVTDTEDPGSGPGESDTEMDPPEPAEGEEVLPGRSMDCDGSDGTARIAIEAECAAGQSCPAGIDGSNSGIELENGNTTIGYFEPGDHLQFSGVALDGHDTLTLLYAKADGGGSIEVRVDSPTGPMLGSTSPQSTGGWGSWNEVEVSLEPRTGTHDLFVVAAGDTGGAGVANLDRFTLSRGGGGDDPPVSGSASAIFVNHLGYELTGPKHAIIEGTDVGEYSVVDASGEAVWCGELEGVAFSEWGGGTYFVADFSGLSLEGEFRVTAGGLASEPFSLAPDRLFDATVESVLGYFRGARADDENVWGADEALEIWGTDRTADVRGGWYDASGDISKYLSHLSYANYMNPQQIPLVTWGLAWVRDEGEALLDARGLTSAAQDEALWGADYLVRAQDPEGYFYINVFDGWSGNMGARAVCAFEESTGNRTGEFQAAFREGGGMAIAALARVAQWGAAGSFAASDYLQAAQSGFEHLQSNNTAYADDGQENIIDDYTALLAASELYAATDDAAYLEAARARVGSLVGRLESSTGYFFADGGSRPFWHASDAGLPVVALARYTEVEPEAAMDATARDAIETHLEYLLGVTGEVANPFGYARQHFSIDGSPRSGFFIPHDNETGYWWQGENARLGSLAAAAIIGGRALQPEGTTMLGVDPRFTRFAGRQLDWVLGANPYDISFMHGHGRNNPPEYVAVKPEVGTLEGGITNGITGREADGSGIQWTTGDPEAPWDDWRWVEQWLPHSTWYIIAATAMAAD